MPNRLAQSLSPYLLQHQHNPVDWREWGEEAFAAAREEEKPVFLSIGYATCHWCHVMERESFEDEEVAALLNAHFVPVKVDREERPDVDALYMSVCQAVTGQGGWPLTVFLTPEAEPFYVGTYFPKHGGGQRPGLMQLLPAVARAWGEEREAVAASAERLTAVVREGLGRQREPGPGLGRMALNGGYNGLAARFDPEWGGFGAAPKFPTPHNLLFLLREHVRTGEERPVEMVRQTLTRMRLGGIFDHVAFGFHRYSTDQEWRLPHFEKMLYDQALLMMAYTEAWEVTGDDLFRQTVGETFAYLQRDLNDPAGAFYSAEDADSLNRHGEKEEGAFYVWSWAEWMSLLGEEDGALAAALYNLEADGNFHDEATRQKTGDNVLFRTLPLADAAERLETPRETLRGRLEAIRQRLFLAREGRPRPLLDDKVLTDWNGLAIAALAKAARAFDEVGYADAAARAADFLLTTLRTEDGRLLHRYRAGQAGLTGLAEDYAFLAWGLLELHQATLETRWLRESVALTEQLLAHFWDDAAGGLFLAPDDGEALLVRQKQYYDGATPSANSVAAYVLARLARLTGRTEWESRAADVLRSSEEVRQFPSGHTFALMALQFLEGPSREIVIAGDPGAEDTRALLAVAREGYRPHDVLHLRAPGDDALAEVAPWTEAHAPRDGRATAYVCEGFACQAPVTDPQALRDVLR